MLCKFSAILISSKTPAGFLLPFPFLPSFSKNLYEDAKDLGYVKQFFFFKEEKSGGFTLSSCKTFCKDGSHYRDLWMHVVTYGVQPLPFWPFLRSIPAHVETRKFSWTSGKGTLSLLYLFFFYFLNYENIAHLQEIWKIQNKRTCSCTIYYNFLIDTLRFLIRVSISNSLKLVEWIYRDVKGYSRPEED